MKIKVKIHRLFNNDFSNIRGYASITLDDAVAIHGVKIMANHHGGLWVALPQGKSKNGYYDIVHPLSKEVRGEWNGAILHEYKRILAIEKKRAEAAHEPMPGQIEIQENNIPYNPPEETLFDYFSEEGKGAAI